MTRSTEAACVACGGRLSWFGHCSGHTYMRCRGCGSIQLHPIPGKAQMLQAYTEEYSSAEHYGSDPGICTRSARNYYNCILAALRDYGVRGSLLDIGAGWGGLCDLLIQHGFQCEGVEMSRQMTAYCRGAGLPVAEGDLESMKGRVFSALVLCTVFEHLVEHDAFLAQAWRLLDAQGLLFTLQPTSLFADVMGRLGRLGNLRSPLPRLGQVFHPPWHTVFFSLKGMKQLAYRNGFDLLEVRPAPQGRHGGLIELAQVSLEVLNRFGWRLMGVNWPLVIAHLFILRKRADFSSSWRPCP